VSVQGWRFTILCSSSHVTSKLYALAWLPQWGPSSSELVHPANANPFPILV
jgi:hypothetical protein